MPQRRAGRKSQLIGHLLHRHIRRIQPRGRMQDPQPVDASRNGRQTRATEAVEQCAPRDTGVLRHVSHMERPRGIAGHEGQRVRETRRRRAVEQCEDPARRARLAGAEDGLHDRERQVVDPTNDHRMRRYGRRQPERLAHVGADEREVE